MRIYVYVNLIFKIEGSVTFITKKKDLGKRNKNVIVERLKSLAEASSSVYTASTLLILADAMNRHEYAH